MTTKDYLASLGVSMLEAYNFIIANLATPQRIYDVSKSAKITTSMLADVIAVYNPSVTSAVVISYFAQFNIDATVLDTSPLLSVAKSKSNLLDSIDRSSMLLNNNNIIQSLDGGVHWTKIDLSYGFNVSVPSDYYGIYASSTYYGNLTTGWQSPSSAMQTAVKSIMTAVSDLTSVTFSLSSSGSADIRFNRLPMDGNTAAFSYYPGVGLGGDVFVDSATKSGDFADGLYGYMTIVHELGHALGLKHPFEDGVRLPTAQDNRANTIMSYTNYKNVVPNFIANKSGYSGSSVNVDYGYVYADSFMVYDIAALQSIYGSDVTTRTGNNTYSYGTTPFYATIWDAGGIDTIDLSATTHSNTVRLTAGSYSDINYRSLATQISEQQSQYRAQLGTSYYDAWTASALTQYSDKLYTGEHALGIAFGVVIENVIGGNAGNTFYDNVADNNLTGGAGNDAFYEGAGGFDTISGGEGIDTLVLTVPKSSVQIDKMVDYSLVVASNFAVKLVGVEQVQFSDQRDTLV